MEKLNRKARRQLAKQNRTTLGDFHESTLATMPHKQARCKHKKSYGNIVDVPTPRISLRNYTINTNTGGTITTSVTGNIHYYNQRGMEIDVRDEVPTATNNPTPIPIEQVINDTYPNLTEERLVDSLRELQAEYNITQINTTDDLVISREAALEYIRNRDAADMLHDSPNIDPITSQEHINRLSGRPLIMGTAGNMETGPGVANMFNQSPNFNLVDPVDLTLAEPTQYFIDNRNNITEQLNQISGIPNNYIGGVDPYITSPFTSDNQ